MSTHRPYWLSEVFCDDKNVSKSFTANVQWTRAEATNAVVPDSSSRTRRETARPRKGADGVEDVHLRLECTGLQKAKSRWRCMSERQKQRARACFRIIQPTEQSMSTDGDLTATYLAPPPVTR